METYETLSQRFARLWREQYGTEPFATPSGRPWRRSEMEILAETAARKGSR